ncbi:MAG: hypothetical protein K2N03_02390 [Muribaculaceae bacterium]|nr:hypothetical protein [Muribaculaceae bacterium]
MAKVKQASIKEIHWKIPTWNQGEGANSRLQGLLGSDSRYFARVSVGPTAVFWNHPRPGWKALSQAPDYERGAVEAELLKVSKLLTEKAGKYGEMLLTRPNDDYVFYQISPEGCVEILFSGWGYDNYKKATGRAFVDKRVQPSTGEARLLFLHDGSPVGYRDFEVHLPGGRVNILQTDGDGVYRLPSVVVGKTLHVKDIPTAREFDLTWKKGETDYPLDVTRKATLCVTVRENGEPTDTYPVRAVINDKIYPVSLFNGEGEIQVAVLDSDEIRVECNEEMQVLTIPYGEERRTIEFDFTKEREVPPLPSKYITVTVFNKDDKPMSGAKIVLRSNESVVEGMLDGSGKIRFKEESFKPGNPINTTIVSSETTYPELTWCIDEGEYEYLLKEETDEKRSIWKTLCMIVGIMALTALAGLILRFLIPMLIY